MNKRLKQLLKILKELYSIDFIKKIALNTKFVKRDSKITAEIFLSLCLFSGEDLCRSSLLQLSTRIGAMEDINNQRLSVSLPIFGMGSDPIA